MHCCRIPLEVLIRSRTLCSQWRILALANRNGSQRCVVTPPSRVDTPLVTPFSQEDDALKRFVAMYTNSEGHPSWADVASAMAQQFDSGHRNTKACRERWFHHLHPGLTDAEWTPAEEVVLFQLQALHGNKWTNISEHLPGRSDQVRELIVALYCTKLRLIRRVSRFLVCF